MTFEELTKEKGYFLSFESILEPRTKEVKLRVIVNKSENPTDLLIFPHPESKVTTLQIDFQNYVTYSVIYDDFTIWNDTEVFQGESFRIYNKSNYFEFIQNESELKGFFSNENLHTTHWLVWNIK
ncbi:hypothetical protein [Psychrobacillus vulpis]|uniref:Uncharacterized protein n=1 Tax=Psychrobacillus vulpis TaxID=2325572 RepID=A0A544TG87_9BACI|nr:hypothetical protein [Psychrobacillus vulpis]TQR16461.1 hypothetical protein FG384_18730 [Psychrobacillus vulpis]